VKRTFYFGETFRIFLGALDLSISKISSQNYIIDILGRYLGMGWEFSEMVINFEGRRLDRNPFRLFTSSKFSIE
jgi:hypothetical protein